MTASVGPSSCFATALLVLGCATGLYGANSSNSAEPSDAERDPQSDCATFERCSNECRGGDASACEWLGRMHETGEEVAQDYERAAQLYEQACTAGRADSCAHLAMMYDIGLAVAEDSSKALELYRTACAGGNRWACRRADQLTR